MTVQELIDMVLEDAIATHAVVTEVTLGVVTVEVRYPGSVSSYDRDDHDERCCEQYRERGAAGTVLRIADVCLCLMCGVRLNEIEPQLWGCNGCGGMFDDSALAELKP